MITIFKVFINEVELHKKESKFMKFEVLKKDNLKRNIIIGVFVVLIISAVVLNFTRAKYRSTASVPIVDSEVNYVRPDLEIIALYIDGVQEEELDSNTNYTLDTASSTCTYKDGSSIPNLSLSYDSETKAFSISPYTTRGTKCTLYFEEAKPLLADIIKGYNQSTRNDFSTVYTASTTKTVFTANDGDGTTYYFAGSPTDNYVSFAGFYWRIIRVNGDGSIRLIYQGTSATATGSSAQIGTSTFNNSDDRSEYVGLKYTKESQYGTKENSIIYTALNTWYEENINIEDEEYTNYIDTNAGFCGDRDMASGSTWSSQPTRTIYYAAYERLDTNKSPSLACSTNNMYTATTSNKGNKSLSSPIGLITADEVAFAGGVYGQTNGDYYLHTGSYYWTMSPFYFNGFWAGVFSVSSSGRLYFINMNNTYGVRPVINLKATTTISSGNGTAQNPFIVD